MPSSSADVRPEGQLYYRKQPISAPAGPLTIPSAPVLRLYPPPAIRYYWEMLHDEVIPILDFGSQYAQLIARRVREKGVYSELVRPDISLEDLRKLKPRGIILSGGPSSVYDQGAPRCDPR